MREISSCSCLTVLPGPAWVLISKTCKPLFAPLFIIGCETLFALVPYLRCDSLLPSSLSPLATAFIHVFLLILSPGNFPSASTAAAAPILTSPHLALNLPPKPPTMQRATHHTHRQDIDFTLKALLRSDIRRASQYQTKTVSSNKITRSRIVLSFK